MYFTVYTLFRRFLSSKWSNLFKRILQNSVRKMLNALMPYIFQNLFPPLSRLTICGDHSKVPLTPPPKFSPTPFPPHFFLKLLEQTRMGWETAWKIRMLTLPTRMVSSNSQSIESTLLVRQRLLSWTDHNSTIHRNLCNWVVVNLMVKVKQVHEKYITL